MAWSRAGRAVLLMRAVNNATPCKVKLLTAHWSTTGGQDLPAILLPIGSLTGCADIPFDLPCPCVSRVPSPCFNLALAPQQTKNPCSCTTSSFVYSTSGSVSEIITHLSPLDALFPPHLTSRGQIIRERNLVYRFWKLVTKHPIFFDSNFY
jgi:hypothetical protein